MPQKIKNKKKFRLGFSLVETLFVMSIFIIILVAFTLFGKNFWTYNTFISSGFSNADTFRQIMKTITAEIRTASTADTGAYVINQATASSFTFYSDIDDDGLREKVRYYLNGTNLEKGVIKPTGSPLSYNGATEKISTLAGNVTNASIFSFYNKNYDGTGAALTFPVNVADIRLVKVSLTIDKDPNRPPAATTFSTQVSIRNLKDNL